MTCECDKMCLVKHGETVVLFGTSVTSLFKACWGTLRGCSFAEAAAEAAVEAPPLQRCHRFVVTGAPL